MQNSNVIRAKARPMAEPARELSWTFMLLVIVCACVVAAGFFFAARQHFTSMEYGIKNSTLREQLRNLETEKRRLLLAREVALSPLAMRKAARGIGLRETSETVAVQVAAVAKPKSDAVAVTEAKSAPKSNQTPAVVRTVLTTPAQPKPTGETRSRIVDSNKDRKEKTEVAALLKLR